jgi:glucosamine--fructose-6-phosphate aminotransferase (isomerizing)
MALVLMALKLGEDNSKTLARRKAIIAGIKKLKSDVEKTLALDKHIAEVAEQLFKVDSLLVMGVGFQFATCLEAALKIKEISYIHCEGIQSTELKHGPLALLDSEHPEKMPILFVVTKDDQYDKGNQLNFFLIFCSYGWFECCCNSRNSTFLVVQRGRSKSWCMEGWIWKSHFP